MSKFDSRTHTACRSACSKVRITFEAESPRGSLGELGLGFAGVSVRAVRFLERTRSCIPAIRR